MLGRAVDEMLWPGRFSREEIEQKRIELGGRIFQSAMQQNPIAFLVDPYQPVSPIERARGTVNTRNALENIHQIQRCLDKFTDNPVCAHVSLVHRFEIFAFKFDQHVVHRQSVPVDEGILVIVKETDEGSV